MYNPQIITPALPPGIWFSPSSLASTVWHSWWGTVSQCGWAAWFSWQPLPAGLPQYLPGSLLHCWFAWKISWSLQMSLNGMGNYVAFWAHFSPVARLLKLRGCSAPHQTPTPALAPPLPLLGQAPSVYTSVKPSWLTCTRDVGKTPQKYRLFSIHLLWILCWGLQGHLAEFWI